MKAILISIKPKWVAKILNGEKTIEIRKTCPEIFKHLKPYEGASLDVFIYCTKEKPRLNIWTGKIPEKISKAILSINQYQESSELDHFMNVEFIQKYPQYSGQSITFSPTNLNGRVVAKFTLNRVEEIDSDYFEFYCKVNANFHTMTLTQKELLKKSCLTYEELDNYVINNGIDTIGYAWHISNLEIFDEPKELGEFKANKKYWCNNCPYQYGMCLPKCEELKPLTKAPQSFQFIEVD